VSALQTPSAGDARPDLAESFLRLSTALVRHAPALLITRSDLADCAALSAARCAGCCHRRVGSCALALLSALLAAANAGSTSAMAAAAAGGGSGGGGSDSQQEHGERPLAAVLARRGPELTRGLLLALLAPSPLPRVHKVAALLLELSNLAASIELRERQPEGQQAQLWLAATLEALPEGALAPGEAQAVMSEWGPLLAHHHSARSYVSLRRLRRIVREFAEQHARR